MAEPDPWGPQRSQPKPPGGSEARRTTINANVEVGKWTGRFLTQLVIAYMSRPVVLATILVVMAFGFSLPGFLGDVFGYNLILSAMLLALLSGNIWLAARAAEWAKWERLHHGEIRGTAITAELKRRKWWIALWAIFWAFVFAKRGTWYLNYPSKMLMLNGLFIWGMVIVISIGHLFGWGRRQNRYRVEGKAQAQDVPDLLAAAQPLPALHALAAERGGGGGHLGWTFQGALVTASPRGGVLVIGPPGSGKTSAVIIPSVISAPGACVVSSMKTDVMHATQATRAQLGRVWHFDPGGEAEHRPGVTVCRWSPRVSVKSWADARRIAAHMAKPFLRGGEGDHFVQRAQSGLEVLLFAADRDDQPISTVDQWVLSLRDKQTCEHVENVLQRAAKHGVPGADIAGQQFAALMNTPAKELGSILGTLAQLMDVYRDPHARAAGDEPNFDPAAFVRSGDTLYITAPPERQAAYAPILSALLEELRFAVYARHRAVEDGREPARPHVTFVLDEANNTAPIPLPAIVSEAGGQSLHLVVGIQDLSRARARWGREADGFLTLFGTKAILPGIIEPYTLDALSAAAGEYEQLQHSTTTNPGIGKTSTTTSTTIRRVLPPGTIAQLPAGQALIFQGATWQRLTLGMHWQHPLWQHLTAPRGATPAPARIDLTEPAPTQTPTTATD